MAANSPAKPAQKQNQTAAEQLSAMRSEKPSENFGQLRSFVAATILLALCFSVPLYHLLWFAAGSALYSHILLVPFISSYLIWLRRKHLPPASEPARQLAAFAWIAGLVVLIGYWVAISSALTLTEEDSLVLTTLAFLLFSYGICCLFLGADTLRAIAFPLVFLAFMVPFPTFVREGIELLSRHSSAATADAMFRLSGMPIFREGLGFQLPGIRLYVAQECSGIHSSLVLFLTSLVAGHLFLHTPWKRLLLVLVVIPLGILRNGFRIFVIGQLCVHIGPQMLYSAIHRQGGPLFFALSLVPFFLLLIVLRKSDRVAAEMKPEQFGD